MPDKSYGWHNYPNMPYAELIKRGIETTFDHNRRIEREIERKECQSRLGRWVRLSDGEYCILSAAYMAYDSENELLLTMRHYPYQARHIKAAQQRIVDSHWKTFVDLSRLYAGMDKPE